MINFISSNKGEKITTAIDFIQQYNDEKHNPEIRDRLNKMSDILERNDPEKHR